MSDNEPLSKIIHELNNEEKDVLLWFLMGNILFRHPFPWRIEKDWSAEVYDAKNVRFINFRSEGSAQQFIDFAQKFNDEQERDSRNLMKELDIEIPEES